MRLADSRQGHGWISIGLHWVVAVATFYLMYNGLGLQEAEGDRGDFRRPAADGAVGLANGARRFGEGAVNAGRQFGEGAGGVARQFAENVFAPRSLHVSVGVITLVFVVARIVWRVSQGTQPDANTSRALNIAAALVQWGLLAALVVLMMTGPLLTWGMGQPLRIFDWLTIPSPLPPLPQWHGALEQTHTLATYAMLALLALHILGALKHAVIDRDGVLQRMLVPRQS